MPVKYENIDLIDALRQITDIHTKHYKEDFDIDQKILRDLAATSAAEDKHLLWMSRPHGTHIMREREAYVEGTRENRTWAFYHDQTDDPILAYSVEITGIKDGAVVGNLIELDYPAHVDRMKQLAVNMEKVAVTFEDQSIFYLPFKTYRREAAAMQEAHGNVSAVAYLPENEQELQTVLKTERLKTILHAQEGNIEDHIRLLEQQHDAQADDRKAKITDQLPKQSVLRQLKEHARSMSDKDKPEPAKAKKTKSKEMEI